MKIFLQLLSGALVLFFLGGEMSQAAAAQSPDNQLVDAAKKGSLNDVMAALASGAKINTPTGPTALFAVFDSYDLEHENAKKIITELLKHGADINAPGPDGKSAFQKVIVGATGYADMLSEFANYKPDLTYKDKERGGVIALALQQGGANYNLVEVRHPGKPSTYYLDNLLPARKFVELGAPVNVPDSAGVTPLMTIADDARAADALSHPYYPDFAKLLLAKGADPTQKDKRGKDAADHAVDAGNYEMLLLLDTNQKHRSDYDKVRRRDLEERLSIAVSHAMIPERDYTPDDPPVDVVDSMSQISDLLKAGADPNALSLDKQTTVFGQTLGGDYAEPFAASPSMSVMKLLLKHGADPNRRLPNGKTPLEIAFNQPHLFALLESYGAKPDPMLQRTLAASPADNDDIREAIFRHQMPHNASALQGSAKVCFLEVLDRATGHFVDPSPALMKRFANNIPRVAAQSECTASADKGVRDKKTGEEGLLFNVGFIKWVADDEVEVEGGYYEAGLSASGNTYHLKKINGKWIVVKDVMNWIS